MRRSRRRVIGLATVLGALCAILAGVGAAPAAAQTYCAPGPCTEGTAEPTIEKAVELADAAPDPDTVAIQLGSYEVAASGCGGLHVSQVSTYLKGAGIGATILTSPPPGPVVGSPDVVCGEMHISDLTLRLPSYVGSENRSASGIDLSNGVAERIRIDAPGAIYGPGSNDGEGTAGLLRGGVARDIEVDLPTGQDTSGLQMLHPKEVSDLTVTARSSALYMTVDPEPGQEPTRVRDAILHSASPLTVSNGNNLDAQVEISDAILDASGTPADKPSYGLIEFNGAPAHSIGLTMDRVTIVGNGAPESAAITVYGQGPTPTTLHASHLAVAGFQRSLVFGRYGGDSLTTIEYSDIDLSPGAIVEEGPEGTALTNFGPGNRSGDPLLTAPTAGNFMPRPGSPAIDIGGPDLLPSTGSDVLGDPRPLDGDRDGVALIDAGALEAPVPPPPPPPALPTTPATGGGDHKVSISVVGKHLILTPGGALRLRLRCPASETAPPCQGSVALRTAGKVAFAGKRRRLALGHAGFSIGAGRAAWVQLKLAPAKAALVRSDPAARRVLALIKVSDAAGGQGQSSQAMTIVPAHKRHRK